MKPYFCFLFLLALVGCNSRDPFPEKKDAIYLDMVSELGAAEKNLAEARKSLEENAATFEKVPPQTGQIHYARKRYFETEKIVALYEQQRKYWVVRSESRRDWVRKNSWAAQLAGKDQTVAIQEELAQYQMEKRLRAQKLNWDVRARLEDYQKGGRKPAGGGGHGEAAPAEGGHH